MSTDGDTVLELLECLEVQDGAGRLQQLTLLQVINLVEQLCLACVCSLICLAAVQQQVIRG